MIRRVEPDDLTAENWQPLGEAIQERQKWPKPLNGGYFFPEVQRLMRMGIAEAWGSIDRQTLLIALFTTNPFTGERGGMVFCWWSLGPGSNEAFDLFEWEAQRRKCAHTYVSVFGEVRSEAIERLYRRKGFVPHERILRKIYG